MSYVTTHEAGSFQFIPGGLFSLGVAALPGYELHRVRFRQPQALDAGFRVIADYLQKQGRPLAALAACELRSPVALTRPDFNEFNNHYVDLLTSHGFSGQSPYPIARSNLAPLFNPPTECALFAFSFTTPSQQEGIAKRVDFVISGKPEIIEEPPGGVFGGTDASAEGLIGKAAFIMQALRQRVTSLGAEWSFVNGAQIYTVHPLEAVISSVFAGCGLTSVGLTLFPSYPPVLGMEFEVDVRAVSRELVL